MAFRVAEQQQCRICGGAFRTVFDAGRIYPSEFVTASPSFAPQPLLLVQCLNCGLVQLKHTIDPDSAYRQYWYKSSLNSAMVQSLREVVSGVRRRQPLAAGDAVVDIGANDGTLLGLYGEDVLTVGFDPALNLAEEARRRCTVFVNDYFSAELYPLPQKAKAVTSIAMFYDLDDPRRFITDVKSILAQDGIWVIQMTDLVSMLRANAFDNLCMEHLEYYSLEVLRRLLEEYGLTLFDLECNQVNGGSVRVYVCRSGSRGAEPAVAAALQAEQDYLQSFCDPFGAFEQRVAGIKQRVMEFVRRETGQQRTFCVMGASTKGNTLLQYFGLDHRLISCAAEINREKVGRKTVGTEIMIIPEDLALQRRPDYCLVLPWHFIQNFVERNRPYLAAGGRFMVPLPEPAVIDSSGWRYI